MRAKKAEPTEDGLSSRVVLDLCHPLLDNHNHVVYMDNFFSSVALCKKLHGFGTYSVEVSGQTERTSLQPKTLLNKLKRGHHHSASSDDTTVTVWKDTKEVSFISNVHSSMKQDTVKRRQRSLCLWHSFTTSSQRLQQQYRSHCQTWPIEKVIHHWSQI